jgi:hypothetical protein
MAAKPKKASTSYSPAPMGRAEKAFTKYAAREKQVGKYGMTKQKDGRLTINVGKKPSTASKVVDKVTGLAKSKVKADIKAAKTVAGVAGKVAGKAAGVAKSKVKADIKAAKTVAGVAGKVAGKAAGVAKAIVKKERPVTKQMYRLPEPMMKQKIKKLKESSDKAAKKK